MGLHDPSVDDLELIMEVGDHTDFWDETTHRFDNRYPSQMRIYMDGAKRDREIREAKAAEDARIIAGRNERKAAAEKRLQEKRNLEREMSGDRWLSAEDSAAYIGATSQFLAKSRKTRNPYIPWAVRNGEIVYLKAGLDLYLEFKQ